jgi:hypothetical protein
MPGILKSCISDFQFASEQVKGHRRGDRAHLGRQSLPMHRIPADLRRLQDLLGGGPGKSEIEIVQLRKSSVEVVGH